MINLIQPITVQQAYDGITHARWWASWNWWWRMVYDDDGDGFPSPEPRKDSRPAFPRGFRAWRRLRIVKRDDFFSLIFFSLKLNIWSWSWSRRGNRGPQGRWHALRGQARPHPRGEVVGPPAFIFCRYFSCFLKSRSVKFQVIPRTFAPAHK